MKLFNTCLFRNTVLLLMLFISHASVEAAPAQMPTIARVTTYETPVGAKSHKPVHESLAFVIEEQGFMLTTYTTLIDSSGSNLSNDIDVMLAGSDQHYPATIISIEPTLDLAILEIDAGKPLTPSKIAPRKDIVAGIDIHAVNGFEHNKPLLTSGHINKLNSMECYQESVSKTMLKTDIDVPDTSRGGPVFNNEGAVIGIYTGHQASEHVTLEDDDNEVHILPIFIAFNIYDSIKNKKSFLSPWTGFSVRPLTPEERAIFPFQRFLGGIAIDYVWKNSPAEKLGIRKDDILVRFSYYPIENESNFQKWLYMYGVDEKVRMYFIRDGKELITYDYTIEERPKWAVPH